MAEVERILLDARDCLVQETDLNQAVARATMDASTRYIDRGTGEGQEPLAKLIAGWLARRANKETAAESLRAAIAAVERDAEAGELSMDLSAFVSTYLDGSMSNRRFGHLLNNPTEPIRTRR